MCEVPPHVLSVHNRPVPLVGAGRLRQSRSMDRIDHSAPCAAWSHHAAELAAPLIGELQEWPESPTMDSLVADGYLQRLVPGMFAPPDVLDTALRRALLLGAAIGRELRRHHVIAGVSAVWVLRGGNAPAPAELLTAAHRSPLAGVQVRHANLSPGDVETLGGAPLTSPVRTALDLLRFAGADTAVHAVRGLLADGHVTESAVLGHLAVLPHHYLTRRARHRWDAVLHGGSPPRTGNAPQEALRGAAAATALPSAVTR